MSVEQSNPPGGGNEPRPATTAQQQWLRAFAEELGIEPPSDEESAALLALAGVAARASERTAAPISCWLAARARVEPAAALARAHRLAESLGGEGAGAG